MKKTIRERALAACLTLALAVGLMPAAFAAGTAEEAIKAANNTNNFDYEYSSQIVTADSNGIVHAVFEKPASTTNGETMPASGDFYAAILPSDKNSADDVRYVRLAESGEKLHLIYFREGCTSFQVMIVQPQPDGGGTAIISSPASLTHYTSRGGNYSYTVNFTATLDMSATLAQIADLNKDDDQMEKLTFTAHIRLPADLNGSESSVRLTSEIFEIKDNGITTNPSGENGFDIECELRNDWTSTETGENLVDKLQERMTFTGTATITGNQIQSMVSAGLDAIYVVGWNSIENIPDRVLGGTKIQVPAVTYALPIDVVNNSGSGGGSSGSGDTRYPIDVSDGITHGNVTTNYDRTTEGTRVTITVKPEDGYRLNSLTVTDKEGNRIEVTANADGTYSFIMPDSGVEVKANFAPAIADPEDTGVADWLNTEDHVAYMVGYSSGSFGPNDNVTRAQVAQMFYRLLRNQNITATTTFKDVPADAWYAQAVNALASLGIVAGVGNGNYEPERAITRAEFCAIAVRFTNKMAEGTQKFADVPETYWAHDYIDTANAYGWVTGYGNGNFGPYDHITRAQAAVIINRMTGRLADRAAIDAGAGSQFPDVSKTFWARYDVIEASTTHDYTKHNGMETWKD